MQKNENEKFIHYNDKMLFVRISELPTEKRKPFLAWLLGKASKRQIIVLRCMITEGG